MIYLVKLILNDTRSTPVFSHYRPDWVGETKPEYNCAAVLLPEGLDSIEPAGDHNGEGTEDTVMLIPLHPEQWLALQPGDTLQAREGFKTVGHATILQVFDLPSRMS